MDKTLRLALASQGKAPIVYGKAPFEEERPMMTPQTSDNETRKVTLRQAGFVGLLGGFVGTLIMDLIIAGLFLTVGMPVRLIYSFIGDVAQSFFLRTGINVGGGVPLGAFVHFSLGVTLGCVFGLLVHQVSALRMTSTKKSMLMGVLYIELASQPILATAPLLTKMSTADLLQWYGLSTVMHLIYGLVLGGVVGKPRTDWMNQNTPGISARRCAG